MPIRSIRVNNVMAFRCPENKDNNGMHDAFELQFSDGINVLIGESGTGKTALLKMIDAAAQWSAQAPDPRRRDSLARYFSFYLKDTDLIGGPDCVEGDSGFAVSDGDHVLAYSISRNTFSGLDAWRCQTVRSVFIPSAECLTHAKGLLALYEKYGNLALDQTQVDILLNVCLPEVREVLSRLQPVLEKLSDAIGGEVVQENGTFYVRKRDGQMVEFSLEAEGLCRLGLLWKLIRNGSLNEGTVLLWDVPEAGMNPELFPLAAEVLLELQKSGVQVFLATNSYNLAKYLEIWQGGRNRVRFHSLYREGPEGAVCSASADTLQELVQSCIMTADLRLMDMVCEM